MTVTSRLRYSPWDGTQVGFEVDALDIMEELTDDLLYSGDVNAALRRLLIVKSKNKNSKEKRIKKKMTINQ